MSDPLLLAAAFCLCVAPERRRLNTPGQHHRQPDQASPTTNGLADVRHLGKFDATLDFDTDNLANAHTTLHIDLTSIDGRREDAIPNW